MQLCFFSPRCAGSKPLAAGSRWVKVPRVPGQTRPRGQEKPPGSAPGQVSLSPAAPAAHSPTYSPAPPLLSSRCRGRSQLDPALPPSPPAEAAARAGREPRSHFETSVSFCWELLNEVALVGPRGVFSSPGVSPCLL